MSFIVKGIDLPEKNKGLYVYIFNGKAEVVHPLDACEVMHINGEAIQIPKGHGDIKDVSKLRVSEYDCEGEVSWYTIRAVDTWDIDNAPTILESEK